MSRARTQARRRTRDTAGSLRTVLLGRPLELTYRHAAGGVYRHKFARGTRVSYSPDGRLLVIDGTSVRAFIE